MEYKPSGQERTLRAIILNLQASHGFDPLDALIAVTKMLAVAFGSGNETKLSFRDSQSDPSTETWHLALKELMAGDARLEAISEFRWSTSRQPYHRFLPHSLELIRRELLRRDELLDGERAHLDVVQAIYRLLVEFWREPVTVLSREAEDYATECLPVRAGHRVYCAYAATAGLALFLASGRRLAVMLELEGPQILAEICAWLSVAGHLDLTIIGGDPLKRLATEILEQRQCSEISNVAFVCPPSDQKANDPDLDKRWAGANLPESTQMCGANTVLATMRAHRSLCFTDGTILFRTYKIDQIFKASLIRDNRLDAIVGLHATVYEGHSSNHGSILIFGSDETNAREKSGDTPRVLMVDARLIKDHTCGDSDEPNAARIGRIICDRTETDISFLESIDTISKQDFNLVVDRYVYPQILSNSLPGTVLNRNTLEQVADIHRPQPLPSASNVFASNDARLSHYFEVGVLDIEDAGFVRRATKKIPSSPQLQQRLQKSRLEPGDIVMVVKGSVGKVAYIREIPQGEIWLASQSFVIIRLRRYTAISEPLVLFRFLSSETGQMVIKPLTVGTAVAGLQMADVRRIKLLLPQTGQEEAIANDVKELFAIQDEIEALRQRMEIKRRAFWPEYASFE